jgi:hypothetical protein
MKPGVQDNLSFKILYHGSIQKQVTPYPLALWTHANPEISQARYPHRQGFGDDAQHLISIADLKNPGNAQMRHGRITTKDTGAVTG